MNLRFFNLDRVLFLLFFIVLSCCSMEKQTASTPKILSDAQLIPKPLKITSVSSSPFIINKQISIQVAGSKELQEVATYLSQEIHQKTNINILYNTGNESESIIQISQRKIADNHPEAYELSIESKKIMLYSATAPGAFRGIQTVRQLLSHDPETNQWFIPAGKISDSPRFSYRGAMLDVARHFFDVSYIKRYMELLAYYKINHLHLHLTDDQGWRIEIKSWPKLTGISGSTAVDGDEGGFYTQEEFKELVEYAALH